MRRVLWAIGLALLAGCGEGRRTGSGGGGGNPDGGAALDATEEGVDAGLAIAPPLGLAIQVASLEWGAPGQSRVSLKVGVIVANGAGAAPVSLAPAGFALETIHGLVVSGLNRPGDCASDLAVAAGARAGCSVHFDVPSDDLPRLLRYQPSSGRSAEASIDLCDSAHPEALCPPTKVCAQGLCGPACGKMVCAAGQACSGGACVDVCSPEHPSAVCLSPGECVQGQCVSSCGHLVGSDECSDCLNRVPCPGLHELTCSDACATCIGSDDWCSCIGGACAGCQNFVNTMNCAALVCPSCFQ